VSSNCCVGVAGTDWEATEHLQILVVFKSLDTSENLI